MGVRQAVGNIYDEITGIVPVDNFAHLSFVQRTYPGRIERIHELLASLRRAAQFCGQRCAKQHRGCGE